MSDNLKAYIFTGISGLNKIDILKKLRREILLADPNFQHLGKLSPEEYSEKARKIIPIIEIAYTDPGARTGTVPNLYSHFEDDLANLKSRLVEITSPSTDALQIKFVFFHTHLSIRFYDHYRTWLAATDVKSLLSDIDVQLVINLIDNIFACRSSMNGQPFSLAEVLMWRDVEAMCSEILSNSIFPGNGMDKIKIVSVNHSIHNLIGLIQNPKQPSAYLAFSISAIRNWEQSNEMKAKDMFLQNLEFRTYFESKLPIFDPSSIDEIPILEGGTLDDAETALDENKILSRNELWPRITEHSMLVSECADEEWLLPINEIDELRSTIGNERQDYRKSQVCKQIRTRDLQLVHQSTGLIVYRPTCKDSPPADRWSRSVRQEVHAAQIYYKPYVIIVDQNDGALDTGAILHHPIPDEYVISCKLGTTKDRSKAFELAWEIFSEQLKRKQKNDE